MSKFLIIAEKPSVAMEFAKVLNLRGERRNGYLESEKGIVSWCVGHLVTMSYPEAYDPGLKKWTLQTLPFLPETYRYEVIDAVKNQFEVLKQLLTRPDVETVYVCTDSGREGEYIYRLVDLMIGVEGKQKKRVWIDSQTEDEIKRGVREAKPLEAYDALAESAFLRAKEDYLAGINFSRLLTLLYGNAVAKKLEKPYAVIAVGRVMTCVLGMVVDREREIINFVKTPFYKIQAAFSKAADLTYTGEWRVQPESQYHESPLLFNENGFKSKEEAEKLIETLKASTESPLTGKVLSVKKSKENKYAPLLYNLAELQNESTKKFKLGPDETLKAVQNLYEKKLVTYPRTDARVLSTAIAGEIEANLKGLTRLPGQGALQAAAQRILEEKRHANLVKTKYVNDDKVTDHYAIIPTGQGYESLRKLSKEEAQLYRLIVLRFLAIFYPPTVYNKVAVVTQIGQEQFFTNEKICIDPGYLELLKGEPGDSEDKEENTTIGSLGQLRKGQTVTVDGFELKEGETTPPKRYTSGSMILAMENAGKLIEDDELREQIKGSGIGTSATRAEIIKKLIKIEYLQCNDKTQVLTPAPMGELVYIVVKKTIPDLLNPKLTASWEKGLEMVAKRELDSAEYLQKLEAYIRRKVERVLKKRNQSA